MFMGTTTMALQLTFPPSLELCVREIPLTKGYVALVSNEDYVRVKQFTWSVTVRKSTAYAKSHKLRQIYLHNFILGEKGIDHKDGNGMNNVRWNLRKATTSQNALNRGVHRNGTSGICYDKSRKHYRVTLTVEGNPHWLGSAQTIEQAKQLRMEGRKRYGLEPVDLETPPS
jgi:hypothetical protein